MSALRVTAFVAFCSAVAAPAVAQDYRFPIQPPASGTAPYITAYRDLNGGTGLQDWNCATNTYNGHRGTDIGIGGFAVMDAGSRWVVAAANGTVSYVVDGCYDRCTSGACNCGGGFGNYVRVTHADGKSTYYGHLMQNSLQVANGAAVTCGQRLGKVGSSGNSTGPHLHFEPRYSNNTSDDPFSGSCGGPTSFWVAQGPYNGLPGTVCEGGNPPPPPPPPPPPQNATGALKGVVWDLSATAAPNDAGNVRVPGAIVTAGGMSATAREGDGFWSFTLPMGAYRLRVEAEGYAPAEREVMVSGGVDQWASTGLEPIPAARDDAILSAETLVMPMELESGAVFEKSWTLKNTGNTTWTAAEGYALIHVDGPSFEAPERTELEPGESIAPGAEKTFEMILIAPEGLGEAKATLQFEHSGVAFGPPLSVEVILIELPPGPEEPDPVLDAGTAPDEPEPEPDVEGRLRGPVTSGGCRCASPHDPASSLFAICLLALSLPLRRKR